MQDVPYTFSGENVADIHNYSINVISLERVRVSIKKQLFF